MKTKKSFVRVEKVKPKPTSQIKKSKNTNDRFVDTDIEGF